MDLMRLTEVVCDRLELKLASTHIEHQHNVYRDERGASRWVKVYLHGIHDCAMGYAKFEGEEPTVQEWLAALKMAFEDLLEHTPSPYECSPIMRHESETRHAVDWEELRACVLEALQSWHVTPVDEVV